jgi:hypothetical protein
MIFRVFTLRLLPLLVLGAMGGLTGCELPAGIPVVLNTEQPVSAYQTVSVLLSKTAESAVTGTLSPTVASSDQILPSETPIPFTPTISGMITKNIVPEQTQAYCDLAAAGNPIDVTIPDDTRLRPGETFVKTWRLINAGTCTWGKDYTVVFFSGDDMGSKREIPLRDEVAPDQEMDISIDMTAPEDAGPHQGNYKLRSATGELFGIGPEGGAPFWVRIVVIPTATLTPTPPTPTPTSTAEIVIAGGQVLKFEQKFDLDTGVVGVGDGADVALLRNGEILEWVPLNGAKAGVIGGSEPGLNECQAAPGSTDVIALGAEMEISYLCGRTNRGLPARILLSKIDVEAAQLEFQYIIWSAP